MDILLLLLWMILLIALLTVPIALGYLLYRWLKKKGYGRLANYIFSALSIFIVYNIYTAIYPTDSFYKDEFEDCFKTKFPKSGTIIAKDATYPSIHGEYNASFIAKLNAKDYHKLLALFQKDTLNKPTSDIAFSTDSYNNIKMSIKGEVPFCAFNRLGNYGENTSIGFMKNNTIVFLHERY